jgi:hypothetical protein
MNKKVFLPLIVLALLGIPWLIRTLLSLPDDDAAETSPAKATKKVEALKHDKPMGSAPVNAQPVGAPPVDALKAPPKDPAKPLPMPALAPSMPSEPPPMPMMAPAMPSEPPHMPDLVQPIGGGLPYDPATRPQTGTPADRPPTKVTETPKSPAGAKASPSSPAKTAPSKNSSGGKKSAPPPPRANPLTQGDLGTKTPKGAAPGH